MVYASLTSNDNQVYQVYPDPIFIEGRTKRKTKERFVPSGGGRRYFRTVQGQQIADMQTKRQQGTTIRTLMKEYGVSKATVYRYLQDPYPTTPQSPAP